MNKRIEAYMVAVLSNPEWMKSVARRYGSFDSGINAYSVGMPEIATAILNLENSLKNKLPEEEFDVEAFAKGSEPPPRF